MLSVKSWICVNCGFVYDEAAGHPESGIAPGNCGFVYEEAAGHPESGIAPGTAWADVPDDWACPDCGAPKSSFEMVEL